ncbi:MAG: D-alanyl-D-alanine carboxypeptidase [Verrucomicrobia bacterium]|nr:D-alanyl-D-alanine carboxypeptidase [Verrucomicrobiota bacterium]
MMRLIQLLMTGAAGWLLASCAEQGVVRAIPVAPNSQHMYAQGDAQMVPVMLPERPMLVATSGPAIRAASYLLLDARTGQHLAGRSFETARGVASTQKLVTALVVLDAGNLDKMVRVQSSDVAVEPTRLGIRPGEVYSRRELLYAFLVKSANDVANALARDNAGSISAFTAKMNAKARALGCANSNFKNPHGLTVGGQYSTARDMARVAMAAYRNDVIRDVVRRKHFNFRRADGRVVSLTNTNELLGVMPECNGMKTGYTVASGRCLISTAASGGREVILVQLGTKTKYIWEDARIMMSWGLQRLRSSSGFTADVWTGN